MTVIRRRVGAGLLAALTAVALAGCEPAVPLTNTSVLTINQSRARYLDALCPLRADDAFWTAARTAAAAAAELEVAEPAISALAHPPKPYPELLAPSMQDLIGILDANRAYFASAAGASGAAALRRLAPPSAVPSGTIAQVESIVTVSAAPGSPNCIDHLPSPAPTAS